MFIKTFGAACQYAPMDGPEHKRGKLTKWGWFLGIQWPFVLVETKVDNYADCKVLNVSRKKVKVYESAYAFSTHHLLSLQVTTTLKLMSMDSTSLLRSRFKIKMTRKFNLTRPTTKQCLLMSLQSSVRMKIL